MGYSALSAYELAECIDTALNRFGSSVKYTVYWRMVTLGGGPKEGIINRPEAFIEALQSIYGKTSSKIESAIVSEIRDCLAEKGIEDERYVQTDDLIDLIQELRSEAPTPTFHQRSNLWKTNPVGETKIIDACSLDQLFYFDPNEGTIYEKNSERGFRYFLWSDAALFSLSRGLFKHFGSAGYVILADMAKEIGADIARRYELVRDTISKKGFILKLCEGATNAGWGKFFVRFTNVKDEELTIAVKNCIFCATRKKQIGADEEGGRREEEKSEEIVSAGWRENGQQRRGPNCFMFTIFAAVLDELLTFPHSCTEEKCISARDEVCQICVTHSPDKNKAEGELPEPIFKGAQIPLTYRQR